MRILTAIVLVLVVLVAAGAIYLAATTPSVARPVAFPLSDSHLALLRHVPASADSFALVPSAALLRGKLLANPVTRQAVVAWEAEHTLPQSWMLGDADLVVWKSGKETSYAVRLDSFRAFLVRGWLLVTASAPVRWDGSTLMMNDADDAESPASLADVLPLTADLPAGDAFVVQWRGARGAFPPIGRPAVTSLRIAPADLVLVSRAAAGEPPGRLPVQARFPRGAMLAVTFAEPPRLVGDLNRLLGAKIDRLVEDGGAIVLYDVDTGTLLPRPKGVIAIPADEEGREAMTNIVRVAELIGDARDTGEELLVSFDRTSLDRYAADSFVESPWPATRWAMRIDPERMVPVLRKLSDSTGLRIAAPRIYRGVRDLRSWTKALENAKSVEAAASVSGGTEELRVRVSSK